MKVFEPHPNIKVYDNVLSFNDALIVEEQCLDNDYTIGWKDTPQSEDRFLHSSWDGRDWANAAQSGEITHFLNILGSSQPFTKLDGRIVTRSVINCNTIADSMSVHNHIGSDVMLYYVNREWKPEWGGETVFYDESGKEIIYTSPYVPNRMILFAGELPHRYNPPSRVAPKYRFSISTFFERTSEEEPTEEEPKSSVNKPDISLRNIL